MCQEPGFSASDNEFEGRVRLYWDKLSRVERKIAAYISENQDAVPGLSIHALAQKIGAGPSSVIRLSKSLGYKGFSELKFQLERRRLQVGTRDVGIGKSDATNIVKQKILQFDYTALEKCVLETDDSVLEHIAEAVAQAGKVYVVGCGASSGAALTGAALFMSLGVPAFSVSDSMLQLRSAAFLSPGDVLIALCYSGYVKEVGDVMFFAKQTGAVSVLITSHRNSLLGSYADYQLFTTVRNRENSINISSTVIGQIVMLQVIQAIVKQKDIPSVNQNRLRLQNHSDMKCYDVKQERIYPEKVRIVERSRGGGT